MQPSHPQGPHSTPEPPGPGSNLHISGDSRLGVDEQLAGRLTSTSRKWNVESKLQLAQLLAILCAGGWAFFTYATFQRESNQLALEAARAQREQADLQLQHARIENAKGEAEVDRLFQTPLATREEITIASISNRPTWYLVTYNYTLTNTGSKTIVIDPVMAEAFVGRTSRPHRRTFVLVNDVGEAGAVRWTCVSRRGFRTAEAWVADDPVVNEDDSAPAERGGGGTGSLSAGETTEAVVTLLVKGQANDFIGFRIRFSIDGGTVPTNRVRLRAFRPLGQQLSTAEGGPE